MTANQALDAALALARDPALAGVMRRQPLPVGVTALLEFVAGEATFAFDPADSERIKAVAERYIQDVMLFPGASSPRILGVNDDDDRLLARAHLKLLMKWLHPDHSDDAWRSAFAGRVVWAWKELSQAPLVAPSRALVVASAEAPSQTPSPRRTGARRKVAWVAHPVPASAQGAGTRRTRAAALALLALAVVALAASLWLQGHGAPAVSGAGPEEEVRLEGFRLRVGAPPADKAP